MRAVIAPPLRAVMPDKGQLLAKETAIRRLLRRAARGPRGAQPSTSFARDSDPNREFSRSREPTAIWFFVFLPIFMLLYAIVEKMHVR
jgi:hypothetical protein